MNIFISNTKSKKMKIIYLIMLSFLLFTLFDRLTFLSIQKLSSDFYNIPVPNLSNLKVSKKEKEFYNTLILGSSRTKHGIHPLYLKKYLKLNSYKAASAGTYLKYNYHFYSIFKKKFKVPEYLIYGFDYFIFKQKSNNRKMNSLLGKKKKRIKKKESNANDKLFSPFHFPSILLSEKKMIETFMVDFIDHLTEKKKKGAISLLSKFKGQNKTISPDLQREPLNWNKFEYRNYPGPEGEYLDKLLSELKKDNVKVFIIILPSFINVYKTNYQHNLFLNEIRTLFDRYPNIKLLNYNSMEKFDLTNPKFFKDGSYGKAISHLSYFGAKVFNKMLCNDISDLIDHK